MRLGRGQWAFSRHWGGDRGQTWDIYSQHCWSGQVIESCNHEITDWFPITRTIKGLRETVLYPQGYILQQQQEAFKIEDLRFSSFSFKLKN